MSTYPHATLEIRNNGRFEAWVIWAETTAARPATYPTPDWHELYLGAAKTYDEALALASKFVTGVVFALEHQLRQTKAGTLRRPEYGERVATRYHAGEDPSRRPPIEELVYRADRAERVAEELAREGQRCPRCGNQGVHYCRPIAPPEKVCICTMPDGQHVPACPSFDPNRCTCSSAGACYNCR